MEHLSIKKVNEVYLRVETTPGVRQELSEFFKFRVPGYMFVPAYKMRMWDGYIRLFNSLDWTIYSGLLSYIKIFCQSRNYTFDLDLALQDTPPFTLEDTNSLIKRLKLPVVARDYQVTAINHAVTTTRALLVSPTGCHVAGTKVIQYDGSCKTVENLQVGDLLMGPDNYPRTVLKTIKGYGKIYKIACGGRKSNKFKSFEVNGEHILSLVHTSKENIINISVEDYIKKSKHWRHCHKLYWNDKCIAFNNDNKTLLVDPYIIGAYLGDGHSRTPALTSKDNELIEHFADYVKMEFHITPTIKTNRSNCRTIRFSDIKNTTRSSPNKFTDAFRKIGIDIGGSLTCGNKYIPDVYKTSSISSRLQLLAGLIDTDGYLSKTKTYYSYTSKSKQLVEDVAFVARSLGFFVKIKSGLKCATNTIAKIKRIYWSCSIIGNISIIPCKLDRKKAIVGNPNKKHNRHCFTVEDVGNNTFYGMQLDGDHLYFLGDWCVTHNSGKSLIIYSLVRHYNKKTLLIVPTISLVSQMMSDFKDYAKSDLRFDVDKMCHPVYAGQDKSSTKPIMISTWQSIYKQPKSFFEEYEVVIGDEVHLFKATSLKSIMEKTVNAKYRFGTTGTLDEAQTHKLVLEGLFGTVFKVTTTKALMDKKQLAELNIKCLILKYSEETRKANKILKYQDEIKFLVLNKKRNAFIRNLAVSMQSNTLVLFQFVESHGKVLHEIIKKKVSETDPNRKVFFISGATDGDIREDIRKITDKEKNAIIVASSGTFSTGINIKNLDNIIFASPTKSRIKTLQSIGRALRIGDSDKATLYDIVDDMTHKQYKNFAIKHFLERVKVYNSEKFKYKLHQIDLDPTK